MVHLPTSSELLSALPKRPPTPPRDNSDRPSNPIAPIRVLHVTSPRRALGSFHVAIHTPPPEPPSSSEEQAGSQSSKAAKRVGWAPWETNYHKAPTFSSKGHDNADLCDGGIKPIPPSRERKPLGSILKPYDQFTKLLTTQRPRGLGSALSAHSQDSFADMLESIAKELAGPARSGRIDAYMTLSGTLKHYDIIPDVTALKEKMGLLMQFLARDMNAKNLQTGAADTPLITQALKTLTVFIWTPKIGEMLTDEFRTMVVHNAIANIESSETSKALVAHYMHLLAQQNFTHKVMNTERADRMVSALDGVETRVKGNSIVGERLRIYQRLLTQARPVMIARADVWTEHLFSGMLSSMKEVRTRAIAFGIEAGLALGTTAQVSLAIKALFNRDLGDRQFCHVLIEKLGQMIVVKDDATHVPQVWSVVVLFLRSRPRQLEHWEHIQSWLLIIQKCFNSSDIVVKFQAHIAWNRLIFAIAPDTATRPTLVNLLRQPIIGQLEKKIVDSQSKRSRHSALSTLCSLLYYSFRPDATWNQLDLYWNEFVVPIVQETVLRGEREPNIGCHILAALFDCGQAKPWNENRANEIGTIKADELPSLDTKWLRSRTRLVLETCEIATRKAPWGADADAETPVKLLWRNLARSIADAGSKEVKASNELMNSLSLLVSSFRRLWLAGAEAFGLEASSEGHVFVRRFRYIIDAAITTIGPLRFTNVVFTPDYHESLHIQSRIQSQPNEPEASTTPLLHILETIMTPSNVAPVVGCLYDMLKHLIETNMESHTSTRQQLSFLSCCVSLVNNRNAPQASSRVLESTLWQVLANLATEPVMSVQYDAALHAPETPGYQFRYVINLLERGHTLTDFASSSTWEELFLCLVDSAKQSFGHAGVLDGIIEPLAGRLVTDETNEDQLVIATHHARILIAWTNLPQDRQSLDLIRNKMWGKDMAWSKGISFNPCRNLYRMVNQILLASYNRSGIQSSIEKLLLSVGEFIDRCPVYLLETALGSLQEGCWKWIEDVNRLLKAKDSVTKRIFEATTQLWSKIIAAITQLPHKSTKALATLDTLISSGLSSCHKTIVNRTVVMWNESFGREDTLEYPAALVQALSRLRAITELSLPTFPDEVSDKISQSPIYFSDSQEDDLHGSGSSTGSPARHVSHSASKPRSRALRRRESLRAISDPVTRGAISKKTTTRQTPKRRLQHESSQVVFTAIASSPLSDVVLDSQLLTDRQKEVKDCQKDEAVMFPDLRPSPENRRSQRGGDLRQLSLSSDLPSMRQLETDRPITPTLSPPIHGPLDDLMVSSPTPRPKVTHLNAKDHEVDSPPNQAATRSLRASEAMDSGSSEPPSSPPCTEKLGNPLEQLGFIATGPSAAAIARNRSDELGSEVGWIATDPESGCRQHRSTARGKREQGELGGPKSTLETYVQEAPQRFSDAETNSDQPIVGSNIAVLPEDVFVDAPSSPTPTSPDDLALPEVFHDAPQSPEARRNGGGSVRHADLERSERRNNNAPSEDCISASFSDKDLQESIMISESHSTKETGASTESRPPAGSRSPDEESHTSRPQHISTSKKRKRAVHSENQVVKNAKDEADPVDDVDDVLDCIVVVRKPSTCSQSKSDSSFANSKAAEVIKTSSMGRSRRRSSAEEGLSTPFAYGDGNVARRSRSQKHRASNLCASVGSNGDSSSFDAGSTLLMSSGKRRRSARLNRDSPVQGMVDQIGDTDARSPATSFVEESQSVSHCERGTPGSTGTSIQGDEASDEDMNTNDDTAVLKNLRTRPDRPRQGIINPSSHERSDDVNTIPRKKADHTPSSSRLRRVGIPRGSMVRQGAPCKTGREQNEQQTPTAMTEASVVRRLREALGDLGKMALSEDATREVDQLLSSTRTEIRSAKRRRS